MDFKSNKSASKQIILYGRGVIAEEYFRYLSCQGRDSEVVCFAVTSLGGQGAVYCGKPCLEVDEALTRYPVAGIVLTLQEKFHAEVIACLREKGREPQDIIGLRRMTELLGKAGREQIKKALPHLEIWQSPHDYSMQLIKRADSDNIFSFYPMTQVPLLPEDLALLDKAVENFADWWGTGLYQGKGQAGSDLEEEDLFLAEATYAEAAKVAQAIRPTYMHTVMGGAAQLAGERLPGIRYDDEGENISRHHPLYSELAVIYWLSKNAPKARYLGLCHYRRHFLLTEEVIAGLKSGDVDVILTPPRLTFPTVEKCFVDSAFSNICREDYELMLKLIEDRDKDCADFASGFLQGQIHFPNNMVIAKREIYTDYAEFMFSILEEMRKRYEEKNIERPVRCLGYLGELLTTIYFAYHRQEWQTAFADYKLLS